RRNHVEIVGGPQMMTEGVLRAALLTYVVLPFLAAHLDAVVNDTDTTTEAMWDKRERMFDQFSEASVSTYRQHTKEARRKLYRHKGDARGVAELVEEAQPVITLSRTANPAFAELFHLGGKLKQDYALLTHQVEQLQSQLRSADLKFARADSEIASAWFEQRPAGAMDDKGRDGRAGPLGCLATLTGS